jgi:hypothetical protein
MIAPVRRWQALQWRTFTITGSPLTVARSDPQWQQAVRSMCPSFTKTGCRASKAARPLVGPLSDYEHL